ncbi:MAG: hypothetical protein JNK52_15785 [Zoogloeaceae bacterium]|nr:hypothetical protein [Zoogloeaceae bacterium]
MDYKNPAECLEALKRLSPVNVIETQAVLAHILSALFDGQSAPNQHLEVLEACREPLEVVQQESGKAYSLQPLPPNSPENETLERVVGLWRLMARSYAQITRRDAAAGTLDDQRALLSQRRVSYAGLAVMEYFRAHRCLPPHAWSDLHESFSMAEAQGVARIRVADPLNEIWHAQSATEAFVAALLVDLANPYGRSGKEFGWICRWAKRFAPYCDLLAEDDVDLTVKPTAYGLDLGLDQGLRPIGALAPGAALRRFDGNKLAGQIQAVLAQFKQGVKPAALGLGEDCPTDASARLLLSLYRPWGLASAGRRYPRRGAKGQIELVTDWLAIGFHVAGKLFEQPDGASLPRSLRSDISLLTFGERAVEATPLDSERRRQQEAEKLGFACDRWEMLDQSVGGFRLRSSPQGERVDFHQLVGVRPPDSSTFLLAQISWLVYRDDSTLDAGVNMLNGIPKVIAARQSGMGVGPRSSFQQAFQLPEVAALKKPASLVLPGGWYQPHRVIEIYDGRSIKVRFTQLLLRGSNFDQIGFEMLNESV